MAFSASDVTVFKVSARSDIGNVKIGHVPNPKTSPFSEPNKMEASHCVQSLITANIYSFFSTQNCVKTATRTRARTKERARSHAASFAPYKKLQIFAVMHIFAAFFAR
jgi:hypothetical protein